MYLLDMFKRKLGLPDAAEALPGRSEPIETAERHLVFDRSYSDPVPAGHETVYLGLGCFWGAERLFWQLGDGIFLTQVGYQGGLTPNATYQEVCSGMTGHAEVVRVVFDPERRPLSELLRTFFEAHDPTQGMRQGNDVGTQYRSAIYTTTPRQFAIARAMRDIYAAELAARGRGLVTTEIAEAGPFFAAEAYHQQYLAKNPNGYCGLAGTGVSCPVPAAVEASASTTP